MTRSLVFIDIETSGLDPRQHEIIELAACRRSASGDHAWIHRRTIMQKPTAADERALLLNRYDQELWDREAVVLGVALHELSDLCQAEDTLVIQNPVFDMSFICPALERRGLHLRSKDHHVIDTASMAWPLVVRGAVGVSGTPLAKPSLADLCKHFGINNDGAHGAVRDVERLMAVYDALVRAGGL